MSEQKLVIISGLIGAGKSELSSQLVSGFGFESRSVGDKLAALLRERDGIAPNQPVPALGRMAIHKEIRQHDPDYFARFLTQEPYNRRVVDGVRNYNDALYCVTRHHATVITLEAPEDVRISRALQRDPVKDPDVDAIRQREAQDMDDPDPDGGQVMRVMELAHDNGFFVDATMDRQAVLEEVVQRLEL